MRTQKTCTLWREPGAVALTKLDQDAARYGLRGEPVMAEQSVGHVQVSGGIEMIEGGDRGEHVTVVNAGVLHCYQKVGLDLAQAKKHHCRRWSFLQ